MKVVSIINYKGGVGKTTVTANLVSEMVSRGKSLSHRFSSTNKSYFFLYESRRLK